MTGSSSLVAAGIVGLNGLFNGAGRIAWATVSDWIGRPITFATFLILQVICFASLPHVDDILTFQIIVHVVMACYGGGFATLPAYIGDLFGTRQVSAIQGYVLTAWALAGISGSSLLIAAIRDATGNYDGTLHIFSVIFLVALSISITMMAFVQIKRRQLHAQKA